MKKIFVLLVICLLLGGCGNTVESIDIQKTENVVEKHLHNMSEVSDSTLVDLYEFDLDKMSEYVIKQNSDGDLYAIIKTDDKVAVKKKMNEYFDKLKEFNQSYSPERLEILENRLEKEIGDYLIYIVAEDSDKIYNDILDSIQ